MSEAGPETLVHRVVVPPALAGARVDRAVAELLELPVNAVRRLLDAGRVRVDHRRRKKGDVVQGGAVVEVTGVAGGPGGKPAWLVPGSAAVPVVFEDAHVVVVDKPAGMPSHPLLPGEGGTAVDALAARFPEIAVASDDPREAGLVHRLDTGTSGCLAVARDRETWRALRDAFAAGTVDKSYLALVHGVIGAPLVVDRPVAHDPADARRMIVLAAASGGAAPGGQPAKTSVTPLATGAEHTLVAVRAQGGRRHQIRVHLACAGHPLVGDVLYGAEAAADAPSHLLHADGLTLPGRPPLRAPLPAGFRAALASRGLEAPDGGM